MIVRTLTMLGALIALASAPGLATAEILAMINYESKTEESLKALKLTGSGEREEGIAIMDVDPDSDNFGKILMNIPLAPDLVAHHIFYDKTMTKAYLTALGQGLLHVIDMNQFPYRLTHIAVDCAAGEDIVFSQDNETWYLTCMGSESVIVGSVATDEIIHTINLPGTYPHGIAVDQGIDRILVTSTARHTDFGDPGETLSVIKASTNEVLDSIKVSNKPSPSGEAPVEVLFVPGADPAVAYVTNMFGGSLWTATWNEASQGFDAAEAFSFAELEVGVPLEIYFNNAVDRLYVTTASPGRFHIFNISGDHAKPELLKTLEIAEGAHHVAVTKDEKLAFVQTTLLNLPGMSDGTIKVVDLEKTEVIATIDTLKNQGFSPNSIVLLPEWNHLLGH